MVNSPDKLEVIPTGAALGAEVRGIDFSQPVDAETAQALNAFWAENLVLLFRGQHINEAQHVAATALFGEPAVGAARKYYQAAGVKPENYTEFPEIGVISNLDADGNPVEINSGLGSEEVVWHSDNSYIETPPAGSFLRAIEIPPDDCGRTSFNNQYLAYETLPGDVKDRIAGLYTKQDSSRNSAGTLRPGVKLPEKPEDVPGPDHPLVRIHPVTGRKALYLGRRRIYPSQYVIGLGRAESEELLDFLWDHATQEHLRWTHTWTLGDMVLWDNRCAMHYREPITSTYRRIMHRTQMGPEKPIAA